VGPTGPSRGLCDLPRRGRASAQHQGPAVADNEYRIFHRNGDIRWVRDIAQSLCDETGTPVAIQGALYDITDAKRAEEERERLQAQLTQAQRMEAVGRLAGGIAHDFNNLLSAILGYSELALRDVDKDTRAGRSLLGVCEVVRQAKGLTQQILAFGRRQVLMMTVLDWNVEIGSSAMILRRLIARTSRSRSTDNPTSAACARTAPSSNRSSSIWPSMPGTPCRTAAGSRS